MQRTEEQASIYRALLAATASLAKGSTPQEVLRAACDALIASSNHISLAWMYLGNPEAEAIRPSYAVGRAAEYARTLVVDLSPEAMKGPGRRSLATNQPVVVNVHTDPTFGLWRAEAIRHGFEEGLTLPIGKPGDSSRGLIVIFADVPEYFGQVGIEPFVAFTQLAAVALEQANLKISLEQMATVDATSNLLNRRAMVEIIDREYAQAKRGQSALSFLLVDLDRFKLLNDNYGHVLGDEMLRQISGILKRTLRSCDWVGRWGGEEFLALLPDTEEAEALAIAERVRKEVEAFSITYNRQIVRTTASIGVASYPRDGNAPDFLLRATDAALYEAKKTGRNRVVAAGEKHEVYSIAARIHAGIESDRLVPAHQPIVDLRTREVVAEEALARLVGENGQPLEAMHFIGAATELQLTHLIDFHIIKNTMNYCATNIAQGGKRIAHFVNVSGDLLLHQELIEKLFSEAQAACITCGVDLGPTKPLVLEITERQLLGDMAAVRAKLAPFLDFGMRLAVDDFGSGYSSFHYLAELPVSFLKIEGTLIKQVRDKRIRQIIKRINDIAKDLNLTTVAEFVEDAETADILCDLGVDWAQGYYFGRPQLHG